MSDCYLYESWHGVLAWERYLFTLKCWTLPLPLELLLVSTPLYVLSVCFFFSLFPSHFPALTPPVSAVCSARRAGRPRSRRWKPQWTSSTTHPPLRFSRPSRRGAAPCSSCPVTRAKPLISSMRSKLVRANFSENMWLRYCVAVYWGTINHYLYTDSKQNAYFFYPISIS